MQVAAVAAVETLVEDVVDQAGVTGKDLLVLSVQWYETLRFLCEAPGPFGCVSNGEGISHPVPLYIATQIGQNRAE